MIPIRLKLTNFLAYRNPDPLEFDGIHLACLTGANGAGKSSLLDAVTWVLWGKARAKTEGELIHSGQTEMSVELEFEHEGNVYLVTRQRDKKGSRLHWVVKRPDGEWKPLNEPSMRDTQRKIISTLKLDYETFTASAFLQQGKADAFTTKTPAERKQILSDILGLELWAEYEKRVKETLKGIDDTLRQLEGRIKAAEDELAREPAYTSEYAQASKDYNALRDQLEEAQKARDALMGVPTELKNARDNHAQVLRRVRDYERDLAETDKEIAQRQTEIQELAEILDAGQEIEARYEELQTYKAQEETLGEQLRRVRDLEVQKNTLETLIRGVEATLESGLKSLEATANELERTIQLDDESLRLALQERINTLETREHERDTLNATLNGNKERVGELKVLQETLKQEGNDLKDRVARLETTQGATCPLCGQPLDENHRQQLLGELDETLNQKRQAWATASDDYKGMQEQNKALVVTISTIMDELAELPRLRAQMGGLEKQRADSEIAQTRLNTLIGEYDSKRNQLDMRDYAHHERAEYETIQAELENIGYDSTNHDTLRDTLKAYSGYETQKRTLERAQNRLPDLQDMLQASQKRYEKLHNAHQETQAELVTLTDSIQHFEDLEQELKRRTEAYNQQFTHTERARGRLSSAEQQLESLKQQKERKQQHENTRQELLVEQSLYEELKLAFGKNGVPAMIIESAIPELEVLANDLLSRMTDGRMNLRLSTQRETLEGNTRETLDIQIADELGNRAYEMYSGGEAFRINFALRVALSKLLARRAGAQLQTLFIDEGFGTQDAEGRSKLVEAITAIQDDFKLVLVITHIEDLRDSFPVHIVVNKTNSGSAVSIR